MSRAGPRSGMRPLPDERMLKPRAKATGALVGSSTDDAASAGELALPLDQPAAHERTACHGTRGGGHGRSTDLSGHVDAVDDHTAGGHLQAKVVEKLCQCRVISEIA